LVIEVVDDFGGLVTGRYLLDGGPEGASCSTTRRAPNLTVSAADLASIYLGEARVGTLAWSGRVAGDPASVRLAQSMFSWHIDPWCTVGF
jgi:predicted acetyltransferase